MSVFCDFCAIKGTWVPFLSKNHHSMLGWIRCMCCGLEVGFVDGNIPLKFNNIMLFYSSTARSIGLSLFKNASHSIFKCSGIIAKNFSYSSA